MIGNGNKKHAFFTLLLLIKLMMLSVNNVNANSSDTALKTIDAATAFQQCRSINNDKERLNCYDLKAKRFAPPTYQGKLSMETDIFSLTKPHTLRYQSNGVIFVLYLRDGDGNVLQNLHIGGRGEDEFVINQPGNYSLKIDGSAGWSIWLEPITKKQ